MDLVIDGLSKTYPNGVEALREVSLNIKPGMFGLLGPNGAGKSTLMRILATLQDPDSGSVRLGDTDVLTCRQEVRKVLGYLPQSFDFYPRIKPDALLRHFAALRGVPSARERAKLADTLLDRVNLSSARKRRLGDFSGGMKQRFGIAVA